MANMSGKGTIPNQPEKVKNRLKTNFFGEGPSNSLNMMRPPTPPADLNFSRQTHYYSNRTHNPEEKMKNWFSDERFPKENSRASSWLTDNKSAQNFTPTFGNTDDFWDNDLSDDFVTHVMSDNFEETLLKATQEANTAKSLLTSTIINQPKPSEKMVSSIPKGEPKPKEKLEISLKARAESRSLAINKTMFPQKNAPKNLFTRQGSSSSIMSTSQSSSILSESQRKLMKPSRSFNLPSSASQAHTTEWLRNQLDKVNKECKSLKDSIATKDGESKILRGKLNEAKLTIEKQKMDKEIESINMRTTLEEKIKLLNKELQNAKTQVIFKTKEAEANIDRYKELKKVNVIEPQFSQKLSSQSFKKFINKSEKLKSSFDNTALLELSRSQIITDAIKPKEVQHIFTQTEGERMEIEDLPKEKQKLRFVVSNYKKEELPHFGNTLGLVIHPNIFEKAKPEYCVIKPRLHYDPYELLYYDVSEMPEDYDKMGIEEKLMDIWNVKEKRRRKKPKIPIKDTSAFSTLIPVHMDILKLCKLPKWDKLESAYRIIEHVTKMARELYVAFRVPEVFLPKEMKERELEIRKIYRDTSKLDAKHDLFSPKMLDNEIYVDLRRGISLVAVMCEIDRNIQRHVLEKSKFIENIEYQLIKTFSPEEINDITCVTDNFTKKCDMATTFLHERSSQLHLNRINEILNRVENIQSNPQSTQNLNPCNKVVDVTNELDEISSSLLFELKSKPKNTKKSLTFNKYMDVEKMFSNESRKNLKLIKDLDLKIQDSLKNISDANTDDSNSEVKNDNEFEKESLINILLNKEHAEWTNSLAPKSISIELQNECNSDDEKEFLNSVFNNFLHIKDSIENEEMCATSEEPVDLNKSPIVVDSDNEEKEITDTEAIQSRKRKLSPDLAEPSTSKHVSKISETFGKNRDLAPFKKLKYLLPDRNNMDQEDIINDLDDIYQAKTQVLPDDEEEGIPKDLEEPEQGQQEHQIDLQEPQRDQQEPPQVVEDSDKSNESGPTYEYLYPEEIAIECELLGIILEIIRCIGCLRFTLRFNQLFEAIVYLLSSLTKCSPHTDKIKVQNLGTMILEILYCRVSPLVLLKIHGLVVRCVLIPGFNKILCHNAHPGKFVLINHKAEFKRGACLLSMLCNLTTACIKKHNWEIQFKFIEWVSYIFLNDNKKIVEIYHKQRTTSGQCSCVKCLDNSIIIIVAQATTSYYGFSIENKLNPYLRYQLKQIIVQGIRIISVILKIDKFFAQNIPLRYPTFVSFLDAVKYLHLCDDVNFQLDKVDLDFINNLLEKKAKHSEKINVRRNSSSVPSSFTTSNRFKNLRSKILST